MGFSGIELYVGIHKYNGKDGIPVRTPTPLLQSSSALELQAGLRGLYLKQGVTGD